MTLPTILDLLAGGNERDPAKLLEKREAITCKGCAFEVRRLYEAVMMRCAKQFRHGLRCPQYLPRDE